LGHGEGGEEEEGEHRADHGLDSSNLWRAFQVLSTGKNRVLGSHVGMGFAPYTKDLSYNIKSKVNKVNNLKNLKGPIRPGTSLEKNKIKNYKRDRNNQCDYSLLLFLLTSLISLSIYFLGIDRKVTIGASTFSYGNSLIKFEVSPTTNTSIRIHKNLKGSLIWNPVI
jgi:hypothetical protein